ncbi:RimJ/RimL family protein N-acetyltransferase [Loktanella sp. PT4BL]|jgi:RimJ/RimL family protein N-acetyltransferase|nr:RimJ/RimL family protein N-acetyltransferase [Loktanella sp. PT4BL]
MTPDLTYRALGADDFAALHAMASDWSIVRQLGRWPWPAQEAFTRSRCKPYAGHGFVRAVCLDGRLIGTMAVTGGELGYMFAPDVQGRGIATKAARDAIAHAFDDYDFAALKATVWVDNAGSAAVLRKCGFTLWQTYYDQSPSRLPTLTHSYRLSRDTWDRLRTAAQ